MARTTQKPSSLSDVERVHCPKCGQANLPARTTCRYCGAELHEPRVQPVDTHPLPAPADYARQRLFADGDAVLLELSPRGQHLLFPVESSVVLGRHASVLEEKFIDLTHFNAQALGVSRQHCRLQRRDIQLLVTDLDSSNFTYLNGERLIPYRPYVVAHGDHLLLGKLHLVVHFNSLTSLPDDR